MRHGFVEKFEGRTMGFADELNVQAAWKEEVRMTPQCLIGSAECIVVPVTKMRQTGQEAGLGRQLGV